MQRYVIHEYEKIIHLSFLVFILAQCSLVLINIKPFTDKTCMYPRWMGLGQQTFFLHWEQRWYIGMVLEWILEKNIQLLFDEIVMPHLKEIWFFVVTVIRIFDKTDFHDGLDVNFTIENVLQYKPQLYCLFY